MIEAIERYKQRTGSYPERVLAEKIYRNRDNLKYAKEWNIRLSGPALGRPKKVEIRNKRQDYIDESERIEAERKFSLSNTRKCCWSTLRYNLFHDSFNGKKHYCS
ncbi:MAG: transposase [Clostridiales bacterium]|nr:transposase [Clostridiales bacterium]